MGLEVRVRIRVRVRVSRASAAPAAASALWYGALAMPSMDILTMAILTMATCSSSSAIVPWPAMTAASS